MFFEVVNFYLKFMVAYILVIFLTTNNYFNFKNKIMGSLLYTIAVILVIIWAISFFGGFYTGGIVHILLVIAIIAILFRVISGRRPL